MYDRPETVAANDRFWALIREGLGRRGVAAPERLTRGNGDPFATWLSPDLVLSQTCGFPYRARLHGHVTLIGTPDYGVEGCAPGHYCSRIVVRADDPRAGLAAFRGARVAYNEALSQSGWAALAHHAPELTEGPVIRTGGHARSARLVADGGADLAAIDAVTWALLARDEPFAAGLRVITSTQPTPGLPLIAAPGADREATRAAVAEAIAALDPADRATLLLRGLADIPAEAYLAVPTPRPPAQSDRSD
jgi:ABC-type phosphate/phosphonate transport system substrate-binding protein